LALVLALAKLLQQASLSLLLFASSSLFHLSLQSLDLNRWSLNLILIQFFSCFFLSFQPVFLLR
jgi:hypothetical protein